MYITQDLLKKYCDKRGNLTEVKKGETGTGLLIEHDGHVIGNRDVVNQIKEDIAHHKEFVIPDKFIVSAVFQKYGIKNANGRVYPEDILKREVEKYINERVRTRCSVGALDHPECQLAGTKVLTEKGWKNIEDVTIGEEILTLNPDTKKIEINKITRKIESQYSGKMVQIKNRSIDLTVTPNHKFPVFNRQHNFKGFYTASDIMNNTIPDCKHSCLLKTGEWVGLDDEYFIIPKLNENDFWYNISNDKKEKYSQNLAIPMDTWAKFMGIYLSEGCTSSVDCVTIYQKKETTINKIREMFVDFPVEVHEILNKQTGCTTFKIYDLRLYRYLKQFGCCYDKFVPYELKCQSKKTLRTFYDWFVMGDGKLREKYKDKECTDEVFSTSKQLVMDLNEIQLKIGYSGSYHEEDRKKDRLIEGRVINGCNCSNMHFSLRQKNKSISLGKVKVSEIDYDGMVYCLEVNNHNFYTMDLNGHCVWSGNSSTLSGHDVSHVITNLEWKGHTLIGEMELHLTPGYRRYGIASTSGDLAANMILNDILIGVSSRGVGSVEERLGVLMVGDDFELIGWDIVLENSTPGAKIGMSREELMQYVESDNSKDNKPIVNEKIDRINKILL